jgi:hypothetical protein
MLREAAFYLSIVYVTKDVWPEAIVKPLEATSAALRVDDWIEDERGVHREAINSLVSKVKAERTPLTGALSLAKTPFPLETPTHLPDKHKRASRS